MSAVEIRSIADLKIGMTASYETTVSSSDIEAFAQVSGDHNPVHLDEAFAAATPFKSRIAHGMLSASYISTVLGTKLPGPGSIYLSQSLRFRAPVRCDDRVVTTVEVTAIDPRGRVTLACACRVGDTIVVDGEAQVMIPTA